MLLKQSSLPSNVGDTSARGLSKAAAPRPGHKFAQIVAQVGGPHCKLGLKGSVSHIIAPMIIMLLTLKQLI